MATPQSTAAPPTSWVITRLRASLEAGVTRHAARGLGGEAGVTHTPDSDSEDEGVEQGGLRFVSVGREGDLVTPGRGKAKNPDFTVAKATAISTDDVHHLYVELKTGDLAVLVFETEMAGYILLAIRAIPPTMNLPVYFMLINGLDTYVWTMERGMVIPGVVSVFSLAEAMPTLGDRWWELVNEIADRV
ncbi:hypothetical protein FRC10_001782 [Ceratobasidium sp. 414]|nr:hypothetical protein FRC10_001782 [Ceratobasidium sp. 414]